MTLLATLRREQLPHPPLTLLFTVREESGLWGARHLDLGDLGGPRWASTSTARRPASSPSAPSGRRAGRSRSPARRRTPALHPEQGISATLVAAARAGRRAAPRLVRQGPRGGSEGTSNVGSFGGRDGGRAGGATNVVTDYVSSRARRAATTSASSTRIVEAYRRLRGGGAGPRARRAPAAQVEFTSRLHYHPFRLRGERARRARPRARDGARPDAELRVTNGGLDANWLVHHGIPTITFGAGQNDIHTVEEFVDLADFLGGCRLAVALARA